MGQWCRRRGCRGCKRTPKSFDLSTIREKSTKRFAKYLKFWANYLQIWIKMALNVVSFLKIGAQRGKNHMKTPFWRSSQNDLCRRKYSHRVALKLWASLGKFGQKSFAPPKICLLLHLCYGYIWNWIRAYLQKKTHTYKPISWPVAQTSMVKIICDVKSRNSSVFNLKEPPQKAKNNNLVPFSFWEWCAG